jgi:hypothetical protein
MANTTTAADLAFTYAEQAAIAVSDGTFADVITTLKTDDTGLEAPASAISKYSGQLWANFVDDYMRATWDSLQGLAVFSAQTPDASPVLIDVAELPNSGDASWLDFRFHAKTSTPGEVITGTICGMIYNNAGVLQPIGDGGTLFTTAPLAAAGGVEWAFLGTTAKLELTGVAGKVIQWTLYRRDAKPVVGP